jgi:hypothetical protein
VRYALATVKPVLAKTVDIHRNARAVSGR